MKERLTRSQLPFYMKLPVFWGFIVLTLLGQVMWVATISRYP